MKKKYVLVTSVIGTLVFFASLFPENTGICNLVNASCVFFFDPIAENLLPIIPLFLLSLITYKMRDEVYRAWIRFAYVWIPLSMFLILIAPEYSADWMFPIVKGTVAFFSSLLFVIISLIIIVWKYFAMRTR